MAARKAPAKAGPTITVTTHTYEPVPLPSKSVTTDWAGELYTAQDIDAWLDDQGNVLIHWLDKDAIRHTVESTLPGGGMGPFYVQVT